MLIGMTILIPLHVKGMLQREEQSLPSQLGEVSLPLINLFFHPFILVMSLVFPVREMKGNPSSVKETYCVSLQLKGTAHLYSVFYNAAQNEFDTLS